MGVKLTPLFRLKKVTVRQIAEKGKVKIAGINEFGNAVLLNPLGIM